MPHDPDVMSMDEEWSGLDYEGLWVDQKEMGQGG